MGFAAPSSLRPYWRTADRRAAVRVFVALFRGRIDKASSVRGADMKRMDTATIAKAFALIALGVGIDQWTKVWAQGRLPGSPLEVIPKALSFVYAENRNMAFGLGGFLPPSAKLAILLVLTGGLTVFLLVLMVRSPDFASRLGYGVTAAGAI
ncbi:MAG TPA: hypothetical protein DFS52_22250, partial [Myxococcales bacterium]|nr:hypothetical protein [Myxococcales bacterium]